MVLGTESHLVKCSPCYEHTTNHWYILIYYLGGEQMSESENYTDVEIMIDEASCGGEIESVKLKINGFIKLKSGKIVRIIPEIEESNKPKEGRSYQ